MFENFLGCYSVIDDNGTIFEISLVDISAEGIQFQVPWNGKNSEKEKFTIGEELGIRIYFTQTSYIPAVIQVRHEGEWTDERGQKFLRYGAEFDQDTVSYEALLCFVNFITKFAEHSVEDKGDSKVYFF